MTQKTNPVEFCPLAKPLPRMDKWIQEGRECEADHCLCFHWDKPTIYKNCPNRKRLGVGK